MDFIRDLWGFLKNRKKFWLLPLIMVLLMFTVIASVTSISPFIYSLF